MDCEKLWDLALLWRGGRAQSGIPELGSNSDNTGGRGRASSGVPARDVRFSLLDIPDAAVCHGRAENKEGTLWRTLVHGLKGKGLKQSSGRLPWGGESLASSGGLLDGQLGLVVAMAGAQGDFPAVG